ncbi:MAG: hypothetical protein PHV17_04270 [Candidatus Omnitrophica bacterium]|nr:hypothetical protein [Candidatus Omnitrophota bacterium]
MNSFHFLLLRLYNLSLGRIPFFSYLLKRVMVYFLIKSSKNKYTASSRYFDYKEFKRKEAD